MDTVKPSPATPKKSKFARKVAKLLHLGAPTGIAPVDGAQNVEPHGKVRDNRTGAKSAATLRQSFNLSDDEELQERVAMEAIVAKLFASISSIKALYAQFQYAQSPYDADGIHTADKFIVSEFKNLSELKRCYIKKQYDHSPETVVIMAEVQEQKSVLKTYEIMGKKLESHLRLKDSEVMYLKEKLEETNKHNCILEKQSNQSGQLAVPDNLQQSGVSPCHFISVLQHTRKSIRSFVKMLIDEMKSAGWSLDAAAMSIVSADVVYWRKDDKCFALESFVSREMFNGFHLPCFSLQNNSLPDKRREKQLFFKRFMELKSMKAKEYLAQKPRSMFARFCQAKYLQLIHPKMETSFFGNLNQRNLVQSGEFPDTSFFALFAEMAKRVWVLHCLSLSLETEASIFQAPRGCRFSEVYMECVAPDAPPSSEADPPVAFTVDPGFRIGKTVIQCLVYLAPLSYQGKPTGSTIARGWPVAPTNIQ